jgi:hypothetical protein
MKRVKKAFTRPLKTAGLSRVNNCCGTHLQDQTCSLRVGDFSCPRNLHLVNKDSALAFYCSGCCVRVLLPDNNGFSLSNHIWCPHLWRALCPYSSLDNNSFSLSGHVQCPHFGGRCVCIPFTWQQQFPFLCTSVFWFLSPLPIPFSCLASFGTVAPVKNKLFRYHKDGSKKLNACNQFFLCMVYFYPKHKILLFTDYIL